MPKTVALLKQTTSQAWAMRRSLVPIILLVMIPVVVLGLLTGNDQILGSYGSLITLIMNVAVIYAVVQLKTGAPRVSVSQAYYEGTARFVPVVLVLLILALQMIPLLLGGLIYISGSQGATIGLSAAEKVLLGGIWLLFALPTLRWLTRSAFGLFLVLDPDTRPLAAVRQSAALVRGRSWKVFGRMLAGAVLMFTVLILPSLAISTLPDQASWTARLATGLLQVLSSLILVPFITVYGYNLLEALRGHKTNAKQKRR